MARLPFIPNKRIFAAVMAAHRKIQAGCEVTKAVNTTALDYRVQATQIAGYVNILMSDEPEAVSYGNPTLRVYFLLLPRIEDKRTFACVATALTAIQNGEDVGRAVHASAEDFELDEAMIRGYVDTAVIPSGNAA